MAADTSAVLVCAGNASRMGGVDKIFMPLGKTTVLGYSMKALEESESIKEIIVVTKTDNFAKVEETAKELGITKFSCVTEGGDTRQKSVENGMRKLCADTSFVAVHDGARPLVRPCDIDKTVADARIFGGAVLGVPVKDTIKTVDDGLVTDTPVRKYLYITQTPQVFKRRTYFEALSFAKEHDLDFTDDSQLVESIGIRVCMTTGDYSNIKITTPEDISIARALINMREEN